MHNPDDVEAARGLQNDFEKNFAFNPQTSSLLSINRSWLGKNFRGYCPDGSFRWTGSNRGRRRNVSVGEAGGLNRSLGWMNTAVPNGSAIAKAGTGYHARYAPGAASTIAITGSGWKIKRS